MSTDGRRRPRGALAVALAAALAGCADRPRAPALTPEAVYQNDSAGLRFLAPDGWPLVAKATPPPGPLSRPLRLVGYHHAGPDRGADLDLYAADLPAGADVAAYLAEHPIGPEAWAAKPPKPETVAGVAAARYEFTGAKRADARREVTAVRRGDRTYLFVFTYDAADVEARAQARRAIESVTWK